MKIIATVTAAFLAIGACALATWDNANGLGLFPYTQTGGNWYTLMTFVNTSEETDDVIYIRFCDVHGSWCSDTPGFMAIRSRGMLIVSTSQSVPIWYPVTAGYGFIMFRVQGGGFIQTFCVVHNQATGSGYTVPAYHQDAGF